MNKLEGTIALTIHALRAVMTGEPKRANFSRLGHGHFAPCESDSRQLLSRTDAAELARNRMAPNG